MRVMADYETEEQQVEALKNWWKENGTAVVTGALLGVAALGGWQGWDWYQEKQANEASDLYSLMQETVNRNDSEAILSQSGTIRSNYKTTPYAALATLHEAKVHAQLGNMLEAESSLRWVIDNSKQDSVQEIARLRLARVLIASNKLDEAADLVNREISPAYSSLANEIRGDIFVAKGETEQAKQAYDQALSSADASDVEYLQMKRNDLGS